MTEVTNEAFLPNIEIDVKELPSRGLAYPEGASVKYRTYMHGEVRKVSTSTIGIENSLKIAMDGIEASFGVKNLTVQDGMYIAILRKVSTLSTMKFTVPYTCIGCGGTSEGIFDHQDIEFEDIAKEIKSLPVFAEVAGKEVEISPLTVGDYLDLRSGVYSDTIRGDELDRVATQAITIRNMKFKEAYDFLYELTDPEDIEVITEIDKLTYHDIKNLKTECKLKVKGKKCGTKNSIKLGGREALIAPFRKSKGTVGTRIRFSPTPVVESTAD